MPLKFDEHHVCSGCRVHDQKKSIDWDERLKWLLEEIEPYRKPSGYECVIGVSGGKDSYYQTHFVKEKLGLKPLLVTYNGNNYLEVGWRNMLRMKEVFGVDHIVISPSVDMLIRINRLGFRKTGERRDHWPRVLLTSISGLGQFWDSFGACPDGATMVNERLRDAATLVRTLRHECCVPMCCRRHRGYRSLYSHHSCSACVNARSRCIQQRRLAGHDHCAHQ